MSKHKPVEASADSGTLEEKIARCAEECGLTEPATVSAGAEGSGVGAWDGARVVKLFEFLQKIWPLIVPLFTDGQKPKTN